MQFGDGAVPADREKDAASRLPESVPEAVHVVQHLSANPSLPLINWRPYCKERERSLGRFPTVSRPVKP